MSVMMSNRQILLIAMALGFLGGFSFVAAANSFGGSETGVYSTAE